MDKHLDKMGAPHAIRRPGEASLWTGPVEMPYVRPKCGVNPGCSLAAQRTAAANKGRRTDSDGLGTGSPIPSPSGTRASRSDLGAVDLTHFELGDGSDSPATRKVMETMGPPDEILPNFLYLAGRKNVAFMDSLPFPQFSHVVFSLNDAPLATPYACDSSFFVDVADQLDADIRPYFHPVCQYIDRCKREAGRDTRVLIHCQHGQSRSGALCLAYVMHSMQVNLREAFEIVARGRPSLKVNVAFISQLHKFEKELFKLSRPSISIEQADNAGWCKAAFALHERGCPVNLEGTTELKGAAGFGL